MHTVQQYVTSVYIITGWIGEYEHMWCMHGMPINKLGELSRIVTVSFCLLTCILWKLETKTNDPRSPRLGARVVTQFAGGMGS